MKTRGFMGTGNRSGAILGMALVMVIAMSLIGLGILQLGSINAVEVARSYNSDKAFWAAEAGIFHARTMLLSDSSFRDMATRSLTGLNPDYQVTKTWEGDNVFTLRSTGTVVSTSRVVWQTVFAGEIPPAAFGYALFGGDGDLWLRKSSSIDGSVFQNGDINMVVPVAITNGTVSVGDPGDAISPSTVPVSTPDPIPLFPLFDPGPAGAGYDKLVSDAAGPLGLVTNTIGSLTLGGTNYISSANLDITGTIRGPGVLAVSGSVTINDNVRLTNNVQIVAGGTLILRCSPCTAGTNCLIYAHDGITVPAKDVSIGVVNLITMGDAGPMFMSLTMTGTLYAAGSVDARKNLNVLGSVMAGEGIEVRKDFTVAYTNLWPVPLIPGFHPDLVVTNIYWQEVF